MSAFASVIGMQELTRRANEIVVTEYRPLEIYTLLILEYLILSSASFEDGLERVLKYQRLISDALHASFIRSPKPHLVSYFTDFSNATSHLAEAMVVGLVRSLNSVTFKTLNNMTFLLYEFPGRIPG